MTEHAQRPLAIGRDIVIPLSMIISLVVFAFQFGGSKVAQERDIATALALATAGSGQIKTLSETLTKLQYDLDHYRETQHADDDRRDHEFLLLKDYTEGRIDGMPYRQHVGTP